MIGLVIITHGELGRQFRLAMEHVVGAQKQIETIGVDNVDNSDSRNAVIMAIRQSIRRVDRGDGVMVLTDIFGGTPSNLAIEAMNGTAIELVSGLNLPMLIEVANARSRCSLEEAVKIASCSGRRYIHVASNMLCRFPRSNGAGSDERESD